MMNFVVTGSSGFLGRVVAMQLLESELFVVKRVVLFDLLSPDWLVEIVDSRLIVVRGDICDTELLARDVFANADVVFHMAAIVDWGAFTERRVFDVNVGGTASVIDACRKAGVRCLIFTSSEDAIMSATKQDLRNIDESIADPTTHANGYCKSKLLAEKLILAANNDSLKSIVAEALRKFQIIQFI